MKVEDDRAARSVKHPLRTVLLVTPDLEIGGAQETVRNLAIYLPREGLRAIVCTFAGGPLAVELEDQGTRVVYLRGRRHSVLDLPRFVIEMSRRRRDLRRVIARFSVDVVQTQGLGVLDFLVMTLRYPWGPQVWWTIQNERFTLRREHLTRHRWLLRPKRAVHRLLYRLGANVVTGVVAVSEDTAQSFARTTGASVDRVHVVPNAVDVERYPANGRRETRRELGLAPSDHAMVMVGTFKRQKGHRHLIEAISLLPRTRFPHLRVLLAGDGALRAEMQHLAVEAGVGDRVRFLGSRRDVPRLLAASDSFVLPSLWEGLAVALVEAMASRLPVIATRVSGTCDAMVDGVTGWLVPPGDPTALARAIEQLLSDPVRAAKMGAEARHVAVGRFSAAGQASRLAALFSEAAVRS